MTKLERLVFFGTPAFAVPTLEALLAAGRPPICVVSQPGRPAGRGRTVSQPPVARWASAHGVDLLQVERVRSPEFLERLAELRPDVAVVVAFGQIFPARLLELPAAGCVNLHASLLPKYRGASPVAAAIAAGERETGVTTMIMEQGLDSGPILLQRETSIGAEETTGELERRLARLGAELVVETLAAMESGTLTPRPQNDGDVTYAPRLKKEEGRVDWSLRASALFDRLRAFTPWPGFETRFRDRPLKVVWGGPLSNGDRQDGDRRDSPPGTLLGLRDDRLMVLCGGDTVFGVERLQRPGKRPVSARDFVNGEHAEPGERLT